MSETYGAPLSEEQQKRLDELLAKDDEAMTDAERDELRSLSNPVPTPPPLGHGPQAPLPRPMPIGSPAAMLGAPLPPLTPEGETRLAALKDRDPASLSTGEQAEMQNLEAHGAVPDEPAPPANSGHTFLSMIESIALGFEHMANDPKHAVLGLLARDLKSRVAQIRELL